MAGGISVAESNRAKKAPKRLHHIEIHPQLGGGHIVAHHHTSYEHPPEEHFFKNGDGHRAIAHIAKHAGLPHEEIGEEEGSKPEPELD